MRAKKSIRKKSFLKNQLFFLANELYSIVLSATPRYLKILYICQKIYYETDGQRQ